MWILAFITNLLKILKRNIVLMIELYRFDDWTVWVKINWTYFIQLRWRKFLILSIKSAVHKGRMPKILYLENFSFKRAKKYFIISYLIYLSLSDLLRWIIDIQLAALFWIAVLMHIRYFLYQICHCNGWMAKGWPMHCKLWIFDTKGVKK